MPARRLAIFFGPLLWGCLLFASTRPPHPGAVAAASPQDMNFTLEGKITDKSEGKLTVSSSENIIFHVLFNDKTEIKKKDGSPGTAQDLHVGLKISVAGDLAESGEITAKKIDIEPEGSDNRSAPQVPGS
ncbi:MAG TPA: DUF5666 domain-containing protein [Terriglobia bacterium]|nr:DUF5666 domain-containing protein [Terriglobia bacterium]